ncbi:MAG: glycosyltransferase [Terriglobia bacterium]|jgi:glycosyltransferase involved in cell wall biosynthesis
MAMVSVIIPTRNRLAFLKEAMASVSAQDYPNRETIVVDDASEDGTWEWLSSLQDPRVRIFRLPHHAERSAARNLGLSNAQGEFVLFLDDDDLLAPGALSYLLKGARREPQALAVVGARISFDDRGHWYRPPHPRWRVKRKVWTDVLFGYIPPQGQTLIRRGTLPAAGCWNEGWSVAEDYELWMRLISKDSLLLFLPRTVRKMRIHPNQTPLVGRYRDCINLRRDFVRRLPEDMQGLGGRIFRALRLYILAARCLARCKYGKAIGYYLLAIGNAPRLLASLLTRSMLLGGLWRALAGLIFGKNFLIRAQKAKAFIRTSWMSVRA